MGYLEFEGAAILDGAMLWRGAPDALPRPTPRARAITLHTGLAEARSGLSYLRESLKLSMRAHTHPSATRAWVPYWNSSPLLSALARAQPGVLKKIYRPYLSNRFRCQQRLDVLTSHYALIARAGLGALVLAAARAPVRLAEFAAKSGGLYTIELVAMARMEREGELVLQLSTEGVVIFSVAFTCFEEGGVRAVAIGCLQGGRSDDALDKIRGATRELFGLRPKTLMVRLVQHIGHQLGCRDLLLVGNRNRVVHQQIRKGLVSADYDGSWTELGATERADGDFVLPCTALAAPDLAAIASSKRSEARKRYALLGDVADATWAGMRPALALAA